MHHLVSRPFRDRKANICEALSLMSLVAICTFNLAEVTLITQGLEPTGSKETFLRVRVDRGRFAWLSTGYSLHPGGACGLISSHTSTVPLPQTTTKNHVSTLSVLKVLGQIIVQMNTTRTVICNDHHVIT